MNDDLILPPQMPNNINESFGDVSYTSLIFNVLKECFDVRICPSELVSFVPTVLQLLKESWTDFLDAADWNVSSFGYANFYPE